MKWPVKLLPNKEYTQATQELKILEEEVVAARNFIRNNYHNYFKTVKKIPIYLILGPSRFGKSTILSQSGLELIDVNNQPPGNVTPTKYCSFWFTREALYIDTAGTYTKPDITRPRNDIIWQGFIRLLQKYFGKNSIAGALIVLDLPAIAQDDSLLKKTLFCVRERIYDTVAATKTIRLHIVFTKCDRILGFTEFFSLLDKEERTKPFGLFFNHEDRKGIISDFTTKFNKLLNNLNNRIVENLQKSVRSHERSLIKMFPSQLDHLRQTFINVIEKIPNSSQITLSGIYFTSSIQDGSKINPIKNTILNILNLKEKSTYHLEASDNRSFFVEEIFKKTIDHLPQKSAPVRTRFNFAWLHPVHLQYVYAFLIAILIISLSITIDYQSYQKNITAINQINQNLHTINVNNPSDLYATISQLDKQPQSIWLRLGINKPKSLRNSLTKTYRKLFIHNLTSQIESYLYTAANQKTGDIQKLYHGLQAYLMLGNQDKLDQTYVKQWFDNHWTETYSEDKEKVNGLVQQLTLVLQHKFTIDLNQEIIAASRTHLKNFPPEQLVYLLLENNYLNQNLTLSPTKSISKMYTKENLHKIYDDSIQNIVNNLPPNDWVLGELEPRIKAAVNNNTIKILKDHYLEQYVLAWKKVLHLDPKTEFKDLADAAQQLNAISSAQKETLVDLLQTIKENIHVSDPPAKLTKEINEKLSSLDAIDIKKLQDVLDKLASYINTIAKNPDPNSAAFTEVTKYLANKPADHPIVSVKTLANNEVPVLQLYLLTLATNTWQVIFNATYNHINQAWNRLIIPKYKNTIENRYPLFKESKDDISLEAFHNFFGPHGAIDTFFNQYIEPLVNTDKTNWTWRRINEQQLEFSSTFLEIFLRAALIQKMFYATQTEKPKLEFTLTPVDMTPDTQNFTLSIDGQKITCSQENKQAQTLAWPGPQPGSVTISFINAQGKYFTTSEFGPWAWFRVLDKANVTSGRNTKTFELTFDLNGNAIKYVLTIAEAVNPFIPEIISNFRCQE